LVKALGKKLALHCLSLFERIQKNVKVAFALKKHAKFPETVFLIDEIVISGATLLEAAKILKKAGVEEVYGIALAHGN
jgi:predicted amidophosphoribosyltransferase